MRRRQYVARWRRLRFWETTALSLLLMLSPLSAMGATSGSGTASDPVTVGSELTVGDRIASGKYFRGLTAVNGRTLLFQAEYEPRSYTVCFDASGGTIPWAGEKSTQTLRYNDGSGAASDTLKLPEEPVREGYGFMGWYLRGNQSSDGALIADGSRYMIATEDPEDCALCELSDGNPVARALWRDQTAISPSDGNGPDFATGKQDPSDPWDSAHSHNTVIEQTEAADKTAYRKQHGQTAYQYGRVLFQAETSSAASYEWYLNDEKQEETGASYLLSGIGRDLNGAAVACVVTLNDQKTTLRYETALRVLTLPKLPDTRVTVHKEEGKA